MTQPTPDTSTTAERQNMTSQYKKKLIETSLPLEAINAEASREKSIRHGHPSTLHLYWARRPLAAARAVLFAQLVDDPASRPEEFPTIEAQDMERARLHALIEKLVLWDNSNDDELFEQAREEIRKSNGGELPSVLDPFAGGGAIPLEAQRLGLNSQASDLNPLAVLINKALIEIPPRFKDCAPVSAEAKLRTTPWHGAEGLAEDVRRYGTWLRDEASRRVGDLYPRITAPGGTEHKVIAWIWARTVKSPNPANPIETPLVRSFWLGKKKGQEAYIRPSVVDGRVEFEVVHDANGPVGDDDGTIGRKGGRTVGDGTPFTLGYVREEGRAGRIGRRLMAVVAEGDRGRLFLSPTPEHEMLANARAPKDITLGTIGHYPRDIKTQTYGMTEWQDLYTDRQLVSLAALSDLVREAHGLVLDAALQAGWERGESLEKGGTGAEAYADAVAVYLGLGVSKSADMNNSLVSWKSSMNQAIHLFTRQAIPMMWDFAEVNPFAGAAGDVSVSLNNIAKVIERLPCDIAGTVAQADAVTRDYSNVVISTDPPYYDNIGYSDLADFFYVWQRRALSFVLPSVFTTMLTPKSSELVANPYRHKTKEGAEKFFVDGFNQVFHRIRGSANTTVPLTVYYAYKQQEVNVGGKTSTGWHTLLDGLIGSGWEITATWPMRSEMSNRMLSLDKNALASSIVLACRPRPDDAPTTTRRAFVAALKSELPEALRTLMQGAIAPVDLAQAAIGPGIAVFSRYSRVREADGSDMSVKDALVLVNATLDEVIGDQESDFDGDTRFAIKWYRQYGWAQESSGIADQLARSSDTSIGALERGGIFEAKGGKACLLAPSVLAGDWDVASDDRVSVWEATVRLAAVMAKDGADKVAGLIPVVQTRVNLDAVKELGFLLFHEAEKKRDSKDAGLFNGLVSAWGDLNEQARKLQAAAPRLGSQQAFDFDDVED